MPSALAVPFLVLFLGFWLVDVWNHRSHFKACRVACEAEGGTDSNFIAANRKYGRAAECRCAFEGDEGLSWESVKVPD